MVLVTTAIVPFTLVEVDELLLLAVSSVSGVVDWLPHAAMAEHNIVVDNIAAKNFFISDSLHFCVSYLFAAIRVRITSKETAAMIMTPTTSVVK